jgi:hypothetical protein
MLYLDLLFPKSRVSEFAGRYGYPVEKEIVESVVLRARNAGLVLSIFSVNTKLKSSCYWFI